MQDVRGKFSSEGTFKVYEGDMTDWSDMFDWISRQSWSTARIGTVGCSYLGEGQIIAAQQHHPNHIAAIPQAAGGNIGRVPGRRIFWGSVEGGAFAVSINFGWMPVFASIDKGARPMPTVDFAAHFKTLPVNDMTERVGSPSWDWRNFLERSPDDPWWDAQGYLTEDESISVAALHVSSWFDLAAEALQEAEIFKKSARSPRAADGQFAIISPTVHCASEYTGSPTMVGELNVGDARLKYDEIYLKWFDYWLKGEQNGVLSMPRFQYYVIGRNEWKGSPVWPVANMTETAFYLRSGGRANTAAGDGSLSLQKPAREPADTFTYDPADPVPSRGGSICCTGNPKDQPGSFDQAEHREAPGHAGLHHGGAQQRSRADRPDEGRGPPLLGREGHRRHGEADRCLPRWTRHEHAGGDHPGALSRIVRPARYSWRPARSTRSRWTCTRRAGFSPRVTSSGSRSPAATSRASTGT